MIELSRISLKSVKHIDELSEETYCYTASIAVDGLVVGTVSNRGRGGQTDFHPKKEAKVAAKLAEIDYRNKNIRIVCDCPHKNEEGHCFLCEGEGFYLVSLEDSADYVLTEYLVKKEEARIIKKFLKKGYTHMVKRGNTYKAMRYQGTVEELIKAIEMNGGDTSGTFTLLA